MLIILRNAKEREKKKETVAQRWDYFYCARKFDNNNNENKEETSNGSRDIAS